MLLRWLAVAGQSVTLVVSWRLGVSIPWLPCAAALVFTAVSNGVLEWWLREVRWQFGGGFIHVLLWDVLLLTFLLHWTGGVENPFMLFYLVQITLAAVSLRTAGVAGLGLVAAACMGWLWHRAVPLQMTGGVALPSALRTMGSVVAVLLSACFVITLLLAVRRRSHRLQKERERLRAELDSRERFLSVAALATGFAHELGTPLGTIALAAAEMESHPDAETAAIIGREAVRCQKVLQRLRELGQEATGLSAAPCPVAQIISEALAELPPSQRSRVQLDAQTGAALVACAGLREALLVLLRNALLAGTDDAPVRLHASVVENRLTLSVEDRGAGFTEEMLRHWGEPFRTTRDPGSGMGLGLFFVRRLAASLHGHAEAANRPGGGARVTLRLPLCPPSTELLSPYEHPAH